METLQSYVAGAWCAGSGRKAILVNPTTEEPLAETSTEGVDFNRAAAFAHDEDRPTLRALTFAQRKKLLRAVSRAIHAKRNALIEVNIKNAGNTQSDAKFDIDKATGTLAYYADLGKEIG